MRIWLLTLLGIVTLTALGADAGGGRRPSKRRAISPTYRQLHRDVLINADIWHEEAKILGAGLGFTQIIGLPGLGIPGLGEFIARLNGGTWNRVPGDDVPLRARTSASTPLQNWIGYGKPVLRQDGFPIEFSWPVQPTSVSPTDFRVTLSDGSRVTPAAASIFPNFEYNERSTVVIFGEFGNRRDPDRDPRAIYVVKLEIVRDRTPLTLVGLRGRKKHAIGMSFGNGVTPMTAYQPGKGPTLCAAKISRLRVRGDTGPRAFRGTLPNHGRAIWGQSANFRLRMLTTGGFSPDGVAAVLPSDFERFFRIRVETRTGEELWVTETDRVYDVDGAELEVLGLADLGLSESDDPWTLAYGEDHDNQIDIILRGDAAAMRRITHLHIPASGDYEPFYNPGGPGNDPTPGVTYSQPSPEILQPVTIAIDDPLTVTWFGRRR